MNPHGLFSFLLACSVCGGDPHSLQTKGALMGVLFLLGVIVSVLAGILSVIIVWSRRARRLAQGYSELGRPLS